MRAQLFVQGIGPERVLDKLARAHVPVLAARRTQKNMLVITVLRKDCKKVFAILRGSCYNIVLALERRVLSIEVQGSGAYYEGEVRAILQEGGIAPLSPAPEQTALLTSRILSLPRVSFASLHFEGGVLTVLIEVSDEEEIFSPAPLISPKAGVLEELVVLRGTPCAEIGQQVEAGQTLISERVLIGEREESVLVVGYAVLLCPVEGVFEGSEEAAFEAARLAFGEDAELFSERTEEGWRIYGQARTEVSSHMQ